jgi:hypothetical protein
MDDYTGLTRSDQPLPVPARANGHARPAEGARIKLIRFRDLRPSTDPEYLIKGLIPRTGLVVVWGPPKCGKSFSTMDMMLHVALGWEYHGDAVQGGPTVYCAFEGQSGYGKRAEAFRRHHHLEDDADIPFYLVAARFSMVKDHLELIQAIKEQLGAGTPPSDTKPVAVVLDTLNRSIDGSESDDKDMTAYIKAADAIREEFGCAIIIVHHCGVDATRPRGHTSLTGAVDAQLAVKRDVAGNVMMTVEWMKDGEEGDTVACRLEAVRVGTDSNGQSIFSCVVVPADDTLIPTKAKPTKLPKAAQTALRALKEAVIELGAVPPASNHIPPAVRVVTFDQWRDYAYRRGISTSDEASARRKVGSCSISWTDRRPAALFPTLAGNEMCSERTATARPSGCAMTGSPARPKRLPSSIWTWRCRPSSRPSGNGPSPRSSRLGSKPGSR